ncbi:Myb/SANT-like DNA-binding domain-containing protein [Xylariomycetidae sp. FL0641]|nr:Myb/SANT-like DNA-binding domain-containing protein [Xylariomycetidae sp. FL0641]
MSDEEVDGTIARRNADRRIPRFSWNLAYEETFFHSLCQSVQLGYKENHSFKSGAWERAAIALRDKHGALPEKSHLVNKADNARKRFRMWRGLREDPEFLYNPTTRMVTASEQAWRKHFEREPLSKALRGRPFDHEEYMEILFPDVVGSGGAPKRIMKPRRKNPDGTPVARTSTSNASNVNVDPSVIDPSLDSSIPSLTPVPNPPQPIQPDAQQPLTNPPISPVIQRPASTTIPPRTSIVPNPNALTPPDEQAPNSQSRKRGPPDATPNQAEKRRGRPSRFSSSFYAQPGSTSSGPSLTAALPPNTPHAIHPSFNAPGLLEDAIMSLAEALRARAPPKWPELALDLFFSEFSHLDAEFQLRVGEKILCDETKAMVFVKMTPVLRSHYINRLKEAHMRNNGPGGLSLGRVGDEAS